MAKKNLQYEVHAAGKMPRKLVCPDGQMFVDEEQEIYAFVPKGNNDEEKKKAAKHFSIMCILGAMAVEKLREVCTTIEKFHEVPYNKIKVVKDENGDVFAEFNLSVGGTLELALEGETADLYVDNNAQAFYLKERHCKTFLARIEGQKFVEDLCDKAEKGDEAAKMTLQLMKEYVCISDSDIVE